MIELALLAIAVFVLPALLVLGALAAAGLTVAALSTADGRGGVSLVLRPTPNP
jgi:hypothetical protein